MIIPLKSRFLQLSEEEFFLFTQEMRDFQLEREVNGTILIMAPTGSETGNFNLEIGTELNLWSRQQQSGKAFDSSAGFTLPNQAVRSPDAAWISMERWQALSPQDRKRFAHLAPDFVLEIRSQSDSIEQLKEKMLEYQENGVRLGWLIDPQEQMVWIYRENGTIDQISSFDQVLSGENVLPGFQLRLADFWPAGD